MSLEVSCPACGLRFTLPPELYERKVKGRVTTIRCIECGAEMGVDGTERPYAQPAQAKPLPRAKPKPPTRAKPPAPAAKPPPLPHPAAPPPQHPDSEPPTPRVQYLNIDSAKVLPPLPTATAPEPSQEKVTAPAFVPVAAAEAPARAAPLAPAIPAAPAAWWRRRNAWLIGSAATLGVLVVWGITRSSSPEPSVASTAPSAATSSMTLEPIVVTEGAEHGEPSASDPAKAPSTERGTSSKTAASEQTALPAAGPQAFRTTASRPSTAAAKPASKTAAATKTSAGAAAPQPAEPGTEFDSAAAASALSVAAAQASGCRKPGDPPGSQAVVVVTFAPSGRITSAVVNGKPFAGTETGGCIAAAMRRATVPAFSGKHITVSKTVAVH